MTSDNIDIENWHEVYQEFEKVIGKENTIKIHQYFKGQYINFPMKIYSKEGLEKVIQKEFDGSNAKDLARHYSYSLRHINRIIKDIKNMDKKEV